MCHVVCWTGVHDKGAVEITNCFTVPHNEFEDEVCMPVVTELYAGCY